MSDRPRVVVVGSINQDLSVRVERLPHPGETVIAVASERFLGGKGANQAVAAARMGCESVLIAAVGDDDTGAALTNALSAQGVHVSAIQMVGAPTGQAVVVVDDAGQNQIVVISGANAVLSPAHVASSLVGLLQPGDVVLGSLEIEPDCVLEAARAARAANASFILNPAPPRPLGRDLLSLCHVLTPNETESEALGARSVEDLLTYVTGGVFVTKGAQGSLLYEHGKQPILQPAFDVEVVDTTGAGDVFSAAIACSLARSDSLAEAHLYASAAAALSTRAAGPAAGMPTDAEVRHLIDSQRAVPGSPVARDA